MTGYREFAVLLGSLLVLALFAGCRPLGDASGPIDPDSIQVSLGTGGLIEDGRWSLARISAKAKSAVFRGEVEIHGQSALGDSSPERFRARFEAATTKQTIELPFRPRGWDEVVITFRGSGQPAYGVRVKPSWVDEPGLRVLRVSDAVPPGQSGSAVVEPVADSRSRKDDDVRPTVTGAVHPRSLPGHFLGYAVADIVLLDRTTLAEADPDRLEALREWVRRGGVVAAVPGPEWTAPIPRPVQELFGLAGPLRVAEDGPPDPQQAAQQAAQQDRDAVELAAEPAPGVRVSSDTSLLDNLFGVGSALLFTRMPTKALTLARLEDPASWAKKGWGTIVERSRKQVTGLSSALLAGLEPQAVQKLVLFSGFRYPPRRAVMAFVAIYLGVGFFLAGTLLRRRKRLEWVYLWTLFLAVASTIGIYRFGLLSAIRTQSIDEVSVAFVRSGSRVAAAASFVGISSPDHRTVTPAFPADLAGTAVPSQPRTEPDAMAMTYRRARGGASEDAGAPLPIEYLFHGGAVEIPALRLYSNATRYLRFDYEVDLGGALRADWVADPQDGSRKLRVQNGTRLTVAVSFLDGYSYFGSLGTLEPGKEGLFSLGTAVEILEPTDQERSWARFTASLANQPLEPDISLDRRLVGSRCVILCSSAPLFPGTGLGEVRSADVYLVLSGERDSDG